MNIEDFKELLDGPMGKYFIGRWEYFKEVINIIANLDIDSVLEVGPGSHTIVKNCDIMVRPEDDVWGRPLNKINELIAHDATEKPWPIVDMKYDLFIGLQVWEHLDNKQARAFREVMRTCKMAILSFPYNWNCPKENANYPEHHMIDKELIGDWTCNIKPELIIEVPRSGESVSKGPRLIYFWIFN